jgi:hypothetical protein
VTRRATIEESHPLLETMGDMGLSRCNLEASARDKMVRCLTDNEDWVTSLPALLPPPKGKDYFVVGPEEYSMMLSGHLPIPAGQVLVDGDLCLSGGGWTQLPRTVVRGSVSVSDCADLASFEIVSTGWMAVSDCPSLRELRGEVFGPATVKSCGLAKLGADFRAAGVLFLQTCQNLGTLNCEAGEGLEARGCSVVKTGPAFSAGKYVLIDACAGFHALAGKVAGENLDECWDGPRHRLISPLPSPPLAAPSRPKGSRTMNRLSRGQI